MVIWGPEIGAEFERDRRAAIERRIPVRVPLTSIFKAGAAARMMTTRRSVFCTVVEDGE